MTSEYDRFDKSSERLDVLGLTKLEEGLGRLVVIELKRHGKSKTVDLQAIKYAAYLSQVSFDDVCRMYLDHHGGAEEEVAVALADFLGAEDGYMPQIDDTPRVVLLAADFAPEVTTTVLWLIDNFDFDIRCVRLQPYEVSGELLVASEQLIPLPAAEDYRLGVLHKQKHEKEQSGSRAARLLPRLVDADALHVGDELLFRESAVPAGASPAWSASEPLFRARIVAPQARDSLEWTNPESKELVRQSPSLLAAWILAWLGGDALEGVTSAGVNGNTYWTVDGTKTLRDLGQENGLVGSAGGSIDHGKLAEVCAAIPSGKWTSYGELAKAIGVPGAAQSVASAIATMDEIENAHRVLHGNGKISPGWISTDGKGPDHCRELLESEGVVFSESDRADAGARWIPPQNA